jgi:5-methylthioadenosine/S-adenosylhomocysteine deaminase
VTVYSADWVLPVDGEPIENGAVAVEGGRIAAVGTREELGDGERFEGAAIVPGFVNAHTHIEYAVYAGFGDAQSFGPWLALHIERKARIGFDEVVDIARFGAAMSLASGVTTIGDASFAGAAAVACSDLGLRAIVYLEVFGSDTDGARRQFEQSRARIEGHVSPVVSIGVSPHAPYSTSPEVYRTCAHMGLPIMTHLNESQDELDWLLRGEGPMASARDVLLPPLGETGIERLAREGLLGPEWIAAHCVKVSAEEIELLREADVAVAHCPRSNGFLGCGFAPLAELRAAELRVGVGTDGISSTPSADFFDELRTMTVVARAREEKASALTAHDVLELATLGGARALGLDGEIGSLTPGKRADLAVVSLAGSPYHPWEDPAAAVVFGGSPDGILVTVVEGTERYRKGVTQWHELTDAASSARRALLGRSARRSSASASASTAPASRR